MLTPAVLRNSLFEDWDPFDQMEDLSRIDHKLYGKHSNREMLMDVKEKEDHYEVEIDLPGFKKEDIQIELNDGYLSVTAAKGLKEEEKNKKGKIIRQERYSGSMSRSFYIGDTISSEQIHAKFEDGVLYLQIPKIEKEENVKPNRIMIE